MTRKRKRLIDMKPEDAARDLVRRYGDRAAKVASDRGDDAKTEATANFYERVQDLVRDAKYRPPQVQSQTQGPVFGSPTWPAASYPKYAGLGPADADEAARRRSKWMPKPTFDTTDGAALLTKLVVLAKMQGSARSPFIVADLVGQNELYALQGELMQIISDLAHQLGMGEYVVKALPYCFKMADEP